MLSGLFGKKVGMTQFFTDDGNRVPVTVVQAGPVTVVQKKSTEKDGYQSIQVGFEPVKESKLKNVNKAKKGHFKDIKPMRHLGEFSTEDFDAIELGQIITLDIFEKGELVDVVGTSKGRGFSGVMKRHNFSGGPASHGHRFNRGTGAIGQSATPARIFKNKKMAGQYGNKRVTAQRCEIVDVNKDLNVLLIKGSIPGSNGRLVRVSKTSKPLK